MLFQGQAAADGDYFAATCGRDLRASEVDIVQRTLLEAYRFQYILSGARHPHFVATLACLATDAQLDRIHNALTFPAPSGRWPQPEPPPTLIA